jgi:hypothetical protein
VLTHLEQNAHNTFDRPATVVPGAGPTELRGEELRVVLRPASINRFDIVLA